jgi:hypothetical protein
MKQEYLSGRYTTQRSIPRREERSEPFSNSDAESNRRLGVTQVHGYGAAEGYEL